VCVCVRARVHVSACILCVRVCICWCVCMCACVRACVRTCHIFLPVIMSYDLLSSKLSRVKLPIWRHNEHNNNKEVLSVYSSLVIVLDLSVRAVIPELADTWIQRLPTIRTTSCNKLPEEICNVALLWPPVCTWFAKCPDIVR